VIVQSVRGTFGSGGDFVPFRNERADGRATLDWVIAQPWFGDSIVLVGPSYVGYVQWAVAADLPPEVVLTYSTAPLTADTDVIGEVSADIWFSSTAPSADVFVRLCDVDPAGRSWNICDGLTTLAGLGDGLPVKATVRLWATANRFKRGHRIRVQVSSGAFPRYGRNPGTGEPRGTAVKLVTAGQSVHHGPQTLSAVTLPVRRHD
jgi:predicted acyl esterase